MTLRCGVENDHVGDAEGLAGDHQQVAGLHGDVGDRRVADDDLGGGPRQLQELRLVVIDDQILGRSRLGKARSGDREHRSASQHRQDEQARGRPVAKRS